MKKIFEIECNNDISETDIADKIDEIGDVSFMRVIDVTDASRDSRTLSAVPSEERRLLATMIGLAEAYFELFQSDDKPSKAMLVLDRKIINDAKEILRRGIAG